MKKALSILLAITVLLGASSSIFSVNAVYETSNRWDKEGITYSEAGISDYYNVTDNSIELNLLHDSTWFVLKEDITEIGQDNGYTFEGTLHVTEKAATAENWDGINLVFRGADNNNSSLGKAAYIKLFSNGGSSYYSSNGGLTTDNGVPFLTGADTNIVGKDLNFRIRYTPTKVIATINGVELYNEDITNSADLKNAMPRIGIMSQKMKYKVTNLKVYTDEDVADTRWKPDNIIFSETVLNNIFTITKNSVTLTEKQASNWIVLKEDISGIGQTDSYTFEGKLKVTSKDATAQNWDGIGIVFRGDDNNSNALGKVAFIKLFSAGGSSYYTSNGGLTTDNSVPFLTGADTNIVGKDLKFSIRYTPTRVIATINGVELYNEDITDSTDLKNAKPRIGIMAQKLTYDITDLKVYTDEDIAVPIDPIDPNPIEPVTPVETPYNQNLLTNTVGIDISNNSFTFVNGTATYNGETTDSQSLLFKGLDILPTDTFIYKAKMKVTEINGTDAWLGGRIIYKYQDNKNFCVANFFQNGQVYLSEMHNGEFLDPMATPINIGFAPSGQYINNVYDVEIKVIPDRISLKVNGVEIYNVAHSATAKQYKNVAGIFVEKCKATFSEMSLIKSNDGIVTTPYNVNLLADNPSIEKSSAGWNFSNGTLAFNGEMGSERALFVNTGILKTDTFVFKTKMRITETKGPDAWFGGRIVYKWKDPSNYCSIDYFQSGQLYFSIMKNGAYVDGQPGPLFIGYGEGKDDYKNNDYNIEVKVTSSKVIVSVNGTERYNVALTDFQKTLDNQVGVFAINCKATFSNLSLVKVGVNNVATGDAGTKTNVVLGILALFIITYTLRKRRTIYKRINL